MDDDIHRNLEEVGSRFDFGEYEARAYVTILEHGSLTASEVADHADIPQPRVYDTVRSLAETGLIELHESRPMRVVAVDPEQAFSTMQTTLEDLVSELSERFRRPARDSEVVSLVKSRQTILRYLEDAISSAEYELVLSLSPDLLAEYEDVLQERREAGVTIELLIAPAADTPDPAEYDYDRVATRAKARRGLTTPVVAVADGTYSVYTPQATLDGEDNRDSYGVIFNRSELGFLVSAFLNTVVWPSAKTLAETGEPPSFPRRYATIRRCVEDVSHHEKRFYATVRGREVETGEQTTVRGQILETSLSTNRETAAITLDTADGVVDVGGQLAALEDIEAYELAVSLDEPPALDTTY
jgi:sugar-specific transcriptional regulator TrmB